MYTEMSRFSTRTVAMVNDMSDRSSYKSKDQYKWRKDMAEYEKSGELDKEVRIRNIENRYKKRREKMREQEEEEEKERSDKQKARQAAIAKARAEREALLAEAAHQQKPPIPARWVTFIRYCVHFAADENALFNANCKVFIPLTNRYLSFLIMFLYQ